MSSEDFFLNDKETKKIDFKFQKIFNTTGVDRKTLDELIHGDNFMDTWRFIEQEIFHL